MNNKKYDLKKVSKVAVATLFLLFLLVDFLAWPQIGLSTSGIVTAVYLMLYAVGRFLIESLRNDPRGAVGVLSTSQFIAIFMFAAGAVMLSRFVKNSN